MASYLDLYTRMFGGGALLNKVTAAVVVAAEAVRTEAGGTANHANRLLWAARAFADPQGEAKRMLPAVLAANKDLTAAQIDNATDAGIQTAVNAAIDLFATGG